MSTHAQSWLQATRILVWPKGAKLDQGTESRPANRLLAGLNTDDWASLEPHFEHVHLPSEKVLTIANQQIEHAYFPTSGLGSIIGRADGKAIDVKRLSILTLCRRPILTPQACLSGSSR